MRSGNALVLAVLVVAAWGCGDSGSSTETDAGTSARNDSGIIVRVDAGPFDAGRASDAGHVVPIDGGGGSGMATTERVMQVTDRGVTWHFAAPADVGRFITGDYFVVGPVRIASVDPAPTPGRNGSVLNLPAVNDRTGFDDRTEGERFHADLRASFPLDMHPGDRLASSISVATTGLVDNWLREGNGERSSSPVKSISILTCLTTAPPADAFRPSYADPDVRIYRWSQLDRAMIPRVAPTDTITAATMEPFAERLSHPWVDNLFYAFDAQVDYMPMYGREVGRSVGIASLLLMLDLPGEDVRAQQDRILKGLVQYGIDLWGLIRAGYPGWYAHGGHGSGRKWPIIFAGMLLHDAQMASPTTTYPNAKFGEDMQTAFTADLPFGPTSWSGANVVYTGHMGWWHGAPVSTTPGWGAYEHLQPRMWEADLSEGYRRCCTSLAWVGEALAARLMNAQDEWAHDAFFAYVDRWMDPTGDVMNTQTIYEQRGFDYRAGWQRQGQCWDGMVNHMWAAYRRR